MSCITEILRIKGDRKIMPFPENDSIVIEGGGEYKGYEFLITFTDRGHRCGYVAINPSHPCYGRNMVWASDDDPDLDVHGGITFHDQEHSIKKILKNPCKDEWLGFDAMHGNDRACYETIEKYFGSLNDSAKYMKENLSIREFEGMGMKHRTFEYMKEECLSLIDQLIEVENSFIKK